MLGAGPGWKSRKLALTTPGAGGGSELRSGACRKFAGMRAHGSEVGRKFIRRRACVPEVVGGGGRGLAFLVPAGSFLVLGHGRRRFEPA